MARFNVGDTVTLQNTFKVDGTATDPTTVTLDVTDPAGTTTNYTSATITNPSVGVYEQVVTVSTEGRWTFVWTGDDPAADVQDGSFEVWTTNPPEAYATVEQAKAALSLSATDFDDDDAVQRAILTASRAIDEYCGRRFWQDTADTTRYFTARHPHILDLGPDVESSEVATITSVNADRTGNGTYDSTYTEGTDFYLAPRNAGVNGDGYRQLRLLSGATDWPSGFERIEIVGQFGWPSTPDEIVEATILQASRLFKRVREAPFGIAGLNVDGAGMRLLARLDADVELLVSPLARPRVI